MICRKKRLYKIIKLDEENSQSVRSVGSLEILDSSSSFSLEFVFLD